MNRLIKTLLLAVAGIVVLVVLSATALLLLFDPNDFRDDISAQVEAATGRELVIEGDLDIAVFPWLAVEVGRSRLANAAGFGDTPFLSFESARLSVRLMPLILKREIAVGTAELNSPAIALAVKADGSSNWDDLAQAAGEDAAPAEDAAGSGPSGLDIASVVLRDATVSYSDAASGSRYLLENAGITTGRIALDEPFDVESQFDFSLQPGDIAGNVTFNGRTTLAADLGSVLLENLVLAGEASGIAQDVAAFNVSSERVAVNLDNSSVAPAQFAITVLGIRTEADVTSLAWAPELTAAATITVASFAPRELAAQMAIEMPETADPAALGALALAGTLQLGPDAAALSDVSVQLDDTTLRGELTAPLSGTAPIRFDLVADSINVDRYMAPATDAAETSDDTASDDFEIPFELIRGINASGNLRIGTATFADMTFNDVTLGLNAGDDKLRLNPLSAQLFDGSYSGDVQVDASGSTPTLSVNERLTDVSLTPLVQAMFDRENITGKINGSFVLDARGKTLSDMRRSLNGNLSFELADGAWQGVDLWHQLRTARALYKREAPPEATTPARTAFSSVLATGTVTNGVFTNNDLLAEMPFLQVTGSGTANLVEGEVDYALRARVLERPEFISGASDAELDEFTEALIPVRVRGKLTDPSVRPDVEAMFRDEVEDALKKKGDELRDRLLDRLSPPQPEESAEPANGEEEPAAEPDPEELLKKRLKDLLGN